jgi:hypothetical protein
VGYRQEETNVSRAALRDAIRDDLLVALKTREVTADPSFDGAPVLTIPAINEALEEVFAVLLPPPSDKHAEVTTGATIVVHAVCPECGLSAKTIVYLSTQLVAEVGSAELRVKSTTKAKTHVHGQAELEEAPVDQMTVSEILEAGEAPEETVPTEDAATTPEDGCPYPGCARVIDHRGLHRDAAGAKLTDLDIEPTEDQS